jgi:hypothetical protein
MPEDDKECIHEYKLLDTIFTKRECGYRRDTFKRITRFYCIHCLKEVEKVKEENLQEKPEWYFGR